MSSDRTPDFPPDKISEQAAEIRKRFGAALAGKPEKSKRSTVSDMREEREVKARGYGDRRRKKRGKSSRSELVQFNPKIRPETRDLIDEVTDALGETLGGAVKFAFEYVNDHLPQILAERAAQEDEKAIS